MTNDGVDAVKSGRITHDQQSWIETTVTGPDTMVFFWRVSSEGCCDGISLTLDGRERSQIRGEIGWQMERLNIPNGEHEVRWTYFKDGSVDTGEDAGYLDRVILASQIEAPVIISPSETLAVIDEPFEFQVETLGDPIAFSAEGLPTGLSIDSATGLITGVPTVIENATVAISASNANGSADAVLTISVTASFIDALDSPFARFGPEPAPAPWFSQTRVTHDGSDAVQSGDIGDGEATWMSAVFQGPTTLTFWWRVSSEEGFDVLRLELDGEEQFSISGNVPWQERSVEIPEGTHTVRIGYVKDGSVSEGQDAGWVDEASIVVSGVGAWFQEHGLTGVETPLDDRDGNGVPLLVEYALNLNPNLADAQTIGRPTKTGNRLEWTLPQNPGAVEVTTVIEFSQTLAPGSWSPAAAVAVGQTNDTRTLAITLPDAADHLFFRLNVVFGQ